MHAGLQALLLEAPAALNVAAASGKLAVPEGHATTCRTYTNGATIPGAGAGFVAAAAAVVGADSS